jgi:hypothetical protein
MEAIYPVALFEKDENIYRIIVSDADRTHHEDAPPTEARQPAELDLNWPGVNGDFSKEQH